MRAEKSITENTYKIKVGSLKILITWGKCLGKPISEREGTDYQPQE